jgi:hypothetical protein
MCCFLLFRFQPASLLSKVSDSFRAIEPVTRIYLSLTILCTVVHLSGLPAPKFFGLDFNKLYQLWRPFTSCSYFGGLSMSMANNLFFLLNYGQTLERVYGSGTHAWFLIVQVLMLSVLGLVLEFPFQSHAMVAAIVYACSRLNSMESM